METKNIFNNCLEIPSYKSTLFLCEPSSSSCRGLLSLVHSISKLEAHQVCETVAVGWKSCANFILENNETDTEIKSCFILHELSQLFWDIWIHWYVVIITLLFIYNVLSTTMNIIGIYLFIYRPNTKHKIQVDKFHLKY